MAFNDSTKVESLTQVPTVQRASQPARMSLTASDKKVKIILRDFIQDFVQAMSKLGCKVYFQPPKILNYPPEILFLVTCPLYELPESRNQWFYTYHNYHTDVQLMIPPLYDLCLLYKKESMLITSRLKSAPKGIVSLQTDDTAYTANDAFREIERNSGKRFDSKEVQVLKPHTSLEFNGSLLNYDGTNYTTTQSNHIVDIPKLNSKSFTLADFISERVRGSYVSTFWRPDVSYTFSTASQATASNKHDVNQLNKKI